MLTPKDKFVLKGRVRHADGKPFAGGLVRAFDKDLRSEQPLGETRTDDNGRYEISYTSPRSGRAEKDGTDLIIRVLGARGSILSTSPLLVKARPVQEINLTLKTTSRRSEYEELLVSLAATMRGETPPKTLEDLARLDEEDWYNLVRAAGVPDGVPGKDENARIRNCAAALRRLVEAAFPTAAIVARITRSSLPLKADLSAFFAAHPDFDLLTDSIDRKVSRNLPEPVCQELKRLQRLFRITPDSQACQTLLEAGLQSAYEVAEMGESEFLARFGDALGGDKAARAIHRRAAQRGPKVRHRRMRRGVRLRRK